MDAVTDFMDFHLLKLGGTDFTPKLLLTLILSVTALLVVTKWIERWGTAGLVRRRHVEPGAVAALFQILRYVLLVIGLAVIVQSVGIDLSAFVVVLGTLGIGIGLAVQPLLTNFLSGLVLLVERPLKVGDRIEVDKLVGVVMHIGARATNVRTNDDITVIVPNSQLVSGQIVNWSHDDRRVRIEVPVGVSYDAAPRDVIAVLLELAAAHEGVMKDPAPDVLLDRFDDSSVAFVLRVWTTDFLDKTRVLRSDLNLAISDAFRARSIELPFPQRDVHVRSWAAPPVTPPPSP